MPKPLHATIVLIKSSPTAWDAEGRLCGRSDVPPTGKGLTALTKSIRDSNLEELRTSLNSIYCAPDDLSVQCAKILVSSGDTKVRKLTDLHELDLGLWEGVLGTDLGDRFPRVYSKWRGHPGSVAPPDGESLEDLLERVQASVFKALRKSKSSPRRVGLVLRPYAWGALTCWVRGKPMSAVWDVMESAPDVQAFSIVDANAAMKPRKASKIA